MKYHVLYQRQYFSNIPIVARFIVEIPKFDSIAAARQYIAAEKRAVFVLSYAEYTRPLYIVVTAEIMQASIDLKDDDFNWDLFVSECDDCGKCEDCKAFRTEQIASFLLSNNLLAD